MLHKHLTNRIVNINSSCKFAAVTHIIMEESLTVEQILDDLSKAKANDPVFTIGTKNNSLSDEIRKFIKQQTELQELRQCSQ